MLMIITALGAGAIFGAGLALAGMLNPAKVVGFLDIFGMWDPSLGLVMAGGISVNATGHYFVMKRIVQFLMPVLICHHQIILTGHFSLAVRFLALAGVWPDIARGLLWPACCSAS